MFLSVAGFSCCFFPSRAEILGRPWSVLVHGESETAEGELIDADGGLGQKWGDVMGCVWCCMRFGRVWLCETRISIV